MSAREILSRVVEVWSDVFLVYSFALGLQYALLCVLGFRETLRLVRGVPWQESRRRMQSPLTPPISLVVPAHNECAGIIESTRSLLMLNYPEFEVVIVNDGSTDGTLEALIESFDMVLAWQPFTPKLPSGLVRGVYKSRRHPHLRVIDKECKGSKADAANAGLNLARHPIVAVIDGDSVLDANALLQGVRPFVRDPDRTVAVGGSIRIANGCTVFAGRVVHADFPSRLLPRIQAVEYIRSFLFDRMAWSLSGGLLIISGAFGLFDRRILLEAGGFLTNTLGEDMELTVRIHRRLREAGADYRMRFVPDPVCWTEAPESLRVLRRQRMRWHKGLLGVLWQHRKMFFRPRYGTAGMLAMPCYVLFEVLGPILELSGLVVLPLCWMYDLLAADIALALLLLVASMGIAFSLFAVLLDDIAFRPYPRMSGLVALASAAVLENVGYRQITAWWRVRATFEFLFCAEKGWGKMERRGLGKA
jgi:cellulose synthase/poly-beta-1,6-N-acetylglucosamine synthase-like glycosyltransferase